MNKWLFIIFMLVVGCGDILTETEEDEPIIPLTLYMNREIDDDGNYIVNYSGFNYTEVLYNTLPFTRVYWGSVDSFYVEYQDRIISSPIINYSTYSNSEGEGKQMIYLNSSFISNTPYTIIGCVGGDNCEWLSFIVQ